MVTLVPPIRNRMPARIRMAPPTMMVFFLPSACMILAVKNSTIQPEDYTTYGVMRGLRDQNGKGVLAGLTDISEVNGMVDGPDGTRIPCEGELRYRGYSVRDLVDGFVREGRFGFEETAYLLMFGKLPNETELAKLTGLPTETLEEIQTAAQVLLCKGVGHVLVTIGSRGVFLCDQEGARQYETRKVTPVDTTAAGDTFNGGFAVGLSEGMEVAEAIRLANAAASLSVTRKGAQTSIPSRAEVGALLADRK